MSRLRPDRTAGAAVGRRRPDRRASADRRRGAELRPPGRLRPQGIARAAGHRPALFAAGPENVSSPRSVRAAPAPAATTTASPIRCPTSTSRAIPTSPASSGWEPESKTRFPRASARSNGARQRGAQLVAGLRGLRGVEFVGLTSGTPTLGLVSLTIEGYDPHEAAAVLDEAFRVQVRPGLHCAPQMHRRLGTLERGGTIRLSLGPLTSDCGNRAGSRSGPETRSRPLSGSTVRFRERAASQIPSGLSPAVPSRPG